MVENLLYAMILLLVVNIVLVIMVLRQGYREKLIQIESNINNFNENILRSEDKIQNEISKNREEINKQIFNLISINEEKLSNINNLIEMRLKNFQDQIDRESREERTELKNALMQFEKTFSENIDKFNEFQRERLEGISLNISNLTQKTEQSLENMRKTIENRLENIQRDNFEKLEIIRKTVDEKLHETLEKRLTDSFKLVGDRLEMVHKGLGEMQGLAAGVSDLKRVLGNVKARGILGEIMLEALLKEILTSEQYEMNIATKKGSNEKVEFAIKLPGRDEGGNPVYLPIDAKFPKDNYEKILDCYEKGDSDGIKNARIALIKNIKEYAKDINQKYLSPPNTTEFAIMFLPLEGLYAEVVQHPGIIEDLQRDFKVVLAGPTTLAALLNSLNIGFKTLIIEKRSNEIWNLLQAVKTEFERFGSVLEKAQKKIREAGDEIDTLVGQRTRKIQSKLKNVQMLPEGEAQRVLSLDSIEDTD